MSNKSKKTPPFGETKAGARGADQLLIPAELQIQPPEDIATLLRELVAVEREAIASTPTTPLHPPTPGSADPEVISGLASIATALWRLRLQLVQPGTKDVPKEAMGPPFRAFESAWNALEKIGIRVQDHVGEIYVDGLFLEVLAFQPDPAVTRETIIETVRPSIYFRDSFIREGQVIVGTPERK